MYHLVRAMLLGLNKLKDVEVTGLGDGSVRRGMNVGADRLRN